MATNIKYKMSYVDLLGETTLINFIASGFNGSTTELTGTDTPLVITWPDPGERFAHIRGSEARISFYSDSPYTYLPLFTSGKGSYKIEIYKGGNLFWEGYIYPSVYQQTLGSSPYIIEVTASDGLGRIDAYKFTNNSNEYVFDEISLLDAIRYCVVKTGIGMEIGDAVNLTHNLSSNGFLENTTINSRAFIKDDEWMDCKTVLEEILKSINARIYQKAGRFIVARFDQYGNNFTIREYNAAGGNSGTNSSYIKSLTAADITLGTSLLRLMDGPQLSVDIPVKDITVTNTLASSELINKGNFKPIYWEDETTLAYWTNPNSLPLSQADDGESVKITGTVDFNKNTPSDITQLCYLVSTATNDNIAVNIKLSAYAKTGITNGVNIRLKFRFFTGFTSYYLQDDYTWGTTENYINLVVPNNKFKDFEIESVSRPFNTSSSGYLKVYISQAFGFNNVESSTDFVLIKGLEISNLYYTEPIEYKAYSEVNTSGESSETRDIILGISQVARNEIKHNAMGLLMDTSGTLISRVNNNSTPYNDLSLLVVADYETFNSTPQEQLDGTIMGYLTMNDTVMDTNHGNKKYMISGLSIDDIRCLNEVSMMEVEGSLDRSILYPLADTLPYTLAGSNELPLRLPQALTY